MRPFFTMLRRGLALCTCALAQLFAQAQAFPDRPVTLVPAYPAGSVSDVLARSVAQQPSVQWKQPVLVDNRPGGSQVIATQAVAKAPADGYTLPLCDDGVSTLNPHLLCKLNDSMADITPVVDLAQLQMVLSSAEELPARNLTELVALAKAQPGKLNDGSVGSGNTVHPTMDSFARMAAVDLAHVPYNGDPDVVRDVLANQVRLVPGGIGGPLLQHLKSGAMKPLAVTGPARSPLLPEVSTLAEAGFPRLNPEVNFILIAPVGTPAAVVQKINTAVAGVVKQEIAASGLEPNGMNPLGHSPAALGASLDAGKAAYAELVRTSGVRLD